MATFTPADVQVFYHDTTNGDSSIPLLVKSVTPVVCSGVGPGNKFGYTEFTVTFDPTHQPNNGPSGIANFTGTYSYLIAPDDGANNPIVSPVDSFTDTLQTQPLVNKGATANLPIPSKGTGGTGTNDDLTISTINIPANYNNNANIANQVITGVTLFLTLTHDNGSDLVITLQAPDGQTVTVPTNFGPGLLVLNNTPFLIPNTPGNNLDGGPVIGNYTLTIRDTKSNNTGTLTSWSVAVNSYLPVLGVQFGASMDQNANAVSDENPMTLANGYTGLTPGDVYAVPMPQLAAPVTFTTAAEHPQPAVQPEHAAPDRPRPADRLHAGRRHLGAAVHRVNRPADQ